MTLAEWLAAAVKNGMTRLSLESPRGHVVATGAIDAHDAPTLEAMARNDAAMFSGRIEYGVKVASEDGACTHRFSLVVEGGAKRDEESFAAPMTQPQAFGQVTKALTDVVKEMRMMFAEKERRETEEMKELRNLVVDQVRLLRRVVTAYDSEGKEGGKSIRRLLLEHEMKREDRNAEWLMKGFDEVTNLAHAWFGMVAPKRMAGNCVEQFVGSFDDEQIVKARELLGEERLARFRACKTPRELRDFLKALDREKEGMPLMGLVKKSQMMLLKAAYEAAQKVEAEEQAAAKANGAPSAGSASS